MEAAVPRRVFQWFEPHTVEQSRYRRDRQQLRPHYGRPLATDFADGSKNDLLTSASAPIVACHIMTRREFVLLPAACSLFGQVPAPSEPQNLSFPLENIQSATTPTDLFFVREHFTEPELSLSSWNLKIEGRVRHPLELTLADIIESPTRKLEAVLECAGNAAGGSAASNAVWEGVPLA